MIIFYLHADTGTEVEIRRLSTVSSVLAASGHVFRTKWKWYWLDEHGKWQSYDDEKTTTNSEKIELDYKSGIVHHYNIYKKYIYIVIYSRIHVYDQRQGH